MADSREWDGSGIGIGWNGWEEMNDAPEIEVGPLPPTRAEAEWDDEQ